MRRHTRKTYSGPPALDLCAMRYPPAAVEEIYSNRPPPSPYTRAHCIIITRIIIYGILKKYSRFYDRRKKKLNPPLPLVNILIFYVAGTARARGANPFARDTTSLVNSRRVNRLNGRQPRKL